MGRRLNLMLKLNPIITIIVGVIFTIAMVYTGFLILDVSNGFGIMGWLLLAFSLIIGGFIATYFTKGRRIRYSIYEGLIVSIILSIYLGMQMLNDKGLNYMGYISFLGGLTILITLGAGIGGISGSKKFVFIPLPSF
jgi:hypothetical protein